MRSFWIFSADRRVPAVLLCATLALALAQTGEAAKRGKSKKTESFDTAELTNFALSPAYSQWLVGAVAHITSQQEREQYLRLQEDDQAVEFIERFWRSRDDPSRPWPQEQVQGTVERRAREADKLYSEGPYLGHRSDRGVLYILHGSPGKVDYIQQPPPRRENVEVWSYPANARPGLDGKTPRSQYFFVEKDGRTVEHNPRVRQRPSTTFRG